MEISASNFYESYQVNHFDYIQLMLLEILRNQDKIDAFKFKRIILNFNELDFKRSIKIQIRQTYFQTIESLFSLIYALKPNNGRFYEEEILQRIYKRQSIMSKIKAIAEDSDYLNFLDQIIELESKSIRASEFLFYYGIKVDNEALLEESLTAIKHALKLLANDLSDTREYNSYKHCLRSIPFLKSFTIAAENDLSNKIEFDLSDSMTYYDYNDLTYEIQFNTKKLDPVRDINMSTLASNIISNIICLRRLYFTEDKEYKAPVIFFGKDKVIKCDSHNEGLSNLTIKMRPKKV